MVPPLIEAIQKLQEGKAGALARCRELSTHPAMLNINSRGSRQPLYYAAQIHRKSVALLQWFPELARASVAAGLDLNAESEDIHNNPTALVSAILSMKTPDCARTADALWDMGARTRPSTQTYAMHAACNAENSIPLRWMLARGFDPNMARGAHDGRGALHVVATSRRESKAQLASLLIEYGCDPRIPNDAGRLPVEWALLRKNHPPTAQLAQLLLAEAERLDLQDCAPLAPKALTFRI